MVKAPPPEEEDSRRLCRERKVLTAERVLHVKRIKGLLFCQGISGYEPLRRDRHERLEELQSIVSSTSSPIRLSPIMLSRWVPLRIGTPLAATTTSPVRRTARF